MPFRWVGNGGIPRSGGRVDHWDLIQYNRGRIKIELNQFELKFDSEFETISGTLHLLYKEGYGMPECSGIRVVFAADVKIHFDTKIESRIVTTSSTKNLLGGIDWAEKCVYGTTDVLAGTKVTRPLEDLIFPFEFKVRGRLPKSISWTDNYSVTYCVKAYADDVEIASSEPLDCWGNYDLLQDPTATSPLICDKTLYKGIFSSKTLVRTTLRIIKKGYIPGEIIPVNISINNTSGIPLVALRISFIRRVTLKDGASKRYLSKFGEKSKALGDSTEDFVLDFTFSAPPNISPTFTSTRINIQYFIKMELKCGEQQEINTDSEIIIGTKYGKERNTMFDTTSSCAGVDGSRRSSIVSSTSIQPPSYSTLSSRRQSVETLPPTYEEMAYSALSELTLLDHDKPLCSH